jgi:hypothetical protein
MIGEAHILGLYVPAPLVSAIAAGLLILVARQVLLRLGAYRHVWHSGLFDLALFVLLWTATSAALDHFDSHHLVLSW